MTHNTREVEDTFINAVWEVLKRDSNDLRKQQAILGLYRDALHHQLQKAREEAWKEIIKTAECCTDCGKPKHIHPHDFYNNALDCNCHSELEQDKVCEICHGHGNNGADNAPCLNCGGSGIDQPTHTMSQPNNRGLSTKE